MDKKPHKNSYLLLTLLIISLLLGMLFSFINITFNKKGLSYLAKNVDIPFYLKNEKKINAIIEEKKIPIEVFSYIEKEDYEKDVDIYFRDNKLSKKRIKKLLVDSIKKYENINMIDVYSYIDQDIDSIASIIYSKINDKEVVNEIKTISNIGKVSYIFIALSILITVLIIIRDKKLLYIGLSYVGVSIIIFLSLRNEFAVNTKGFNINGVTYLENSLSNICSIYFVIGIIILLISLIFIIKNVFKDIKRSRIDYEWRYR